MKKLILAASLAALASAPLAACDMEHGDKAGLKTDLKSIIEPGKEAKPAKLAKASKAKALKTVAADKSTAKKI
jgi:hypothetical protein